MEPELELELDELDDTAEGVDDGADGVADSLVTVAAGSGTAGTVLAVTVVVAS